MVVVAVAGGGGVWDGMDAPLRSGGRSGAGTVVPFFSATTKSKCRALIRTLRFEVCRQYSEYWYTRSSMGIQSGLMTYGKRGMRGGGESKGKKDGKMEGEAQNERCVANTFVISVVPTAPLLHPRGL